VRTVKLKGKWSAHNFGGLARFQASAKVQLRPSWCSEGAGSRLTLQRASCLALFIILGVARSTCSLNHALCEVRLTPLLHININIICGDVINFGARLKGCLATDFRVASAENGKG